MSAYGMPACFNGEYFDSRTEAMWARYFESAGIAYVHEPETFGLPNGDLYTPDFFLPHQEVFAEVKNGPVTDVEAYKAMQLARCAGRGVLILNHAPQSAEILCFAPTSTKPLQQPKPLEDYGRANADFVFFSNRHLLLDPQHNHLSALIRQHVAVSRNGWSIEVPEHVRSAHEIKKRQLHQNARKIF